VNVRGRLAEVGEKGADARLGVAVALAVVRLGGDLAGLP
jgi:hypothetical protein